MRWLPARPKTSRPGERDGFSRTMQRNLFNARPIGSALFNPLVMSQSPPAAFARIADSGRPILRSHALTLFVRLRLRCFHSSRFNVTGFRVCLHALSSFQRTDISKRPGRFAHTRVRLRRSFRRRRRLTRPRSGELTEITIAASSCQPVFQASFEVA